MDKMNTPDIKLRWDPYILISDDSYSEFWKNHCSIKDRKILFILGEGFDPRMNLALNEVNLNRGNSIINCLLIKYDEGEGSPSIKYKHLIQNNIEVLEQQIPKENLITKKIKMWKGKGPKRQRISSLEAKNIINDYSDIESYSDIVVDISALPRSIYFPIIGKLLYVIDKRNENLEEPNLFVNVSENTDIDILIDDVGIDESPSYIDGFDGGLDLETNSDKPLIWLPILGENKIPHLEKVFQFLNNPDEICPILPFPSKNPRRSDNIIVEYHKLLFDDFQVEHQNIIYASEQNPFEVYRQIHQTLNNYQSSLAVLGGCKSALSAFSSKLLSIGSILASYELSNSIGVGVVNIEPHGYEIKNEEELSRLNGKGKLFLCWLTGEPYGS